MRLPQPTQSSRRLSQRFTLFDLGSLSVSSVAPAFSISATVGVMARYTGTASIWAILLVALPFLISAFVFRLLNRHFPNAGASYHWSARVLGRRPARFQGWVIILAYFTSLPPILLPAAQYTLALFNPAYAENAWLQWLAASFWIAFSLFPLLKGARPTARITQVFLFVEIVSLALFAGTGAWLWPRLHGAARPGGFSLSGIPLSMIVASTILDGWEIDSYASEEALQPHRDPGTAGIIGVFAALGAYLVFIPLILSETPLHSLARSADPMTLWAQALGAAMPAQVPTYIAAHISTWMLIPVLASTSGSLWLTAYILIRGLYAMGRDRLIPERFGRLNRRGAPAFATWAVFLGCWLILALQLFVRSLNSFFTVALSAAGFFLTLEFMLDNATAMVFVWKGSHRQMVHGGKPHTHLLLRIGSTFTFAYLLLLLLSFLILSPAAVSPWLDLLIALLLLAGWGFAQRRSTPAQQIHIPELIDLKVSQAAEPD